MKIKRNLKTEESRTFWKFVDDTRAEVSLWPAWRKTGVGHVEYELPWWPEEEAQQ